MGVSNDPGLLGVTQPAVSPGVRDPSAPRALWTRFFLAMSSALTTVRASKVE